MPTARFRRFLVYFAPLILWMAVIFIASTDGGSAVHTQSALFAILYAMPFVPRAMVPDIVISIHHFIRKGAHITEYSILAILTYRAIRRERTDFRPIDIWGPILFCFLYGSSDEFHQIFVPSRGPSFGDVMFDTCGGVVGTALCRLAYVVARRKKTGDT